MEIDWTPEDEAAMKEGAAISKSLKNNRPRTPHGVNRKDVQRHLEKENALKKIGL